MCAARFPYAAGHEHQTAAPLQGLQAFGDLAGDPVACNLCHDLNKSFER